MINKKIVKLMEFKIKFRMINFKKTNNYQRLLKKMLKTKLILMP